MTSSKFEFQVVEQKNLLEGSQIANINGFNVIRRKNNEIPLICIRHGSHLIAYQFDGPNNSWKLYWQENIFGEGVDYNSTVYPWIVDDILGTGSDLIVIRNQLGLLFLKPRDNPPGVDRITQDGRFDLFNRQTRNHIILMGHFYSDKSIVGLFSRNDVGDINIYGVIKAKVELKLNYPLDSLNGIQFSSSWTNPDTSIFRTDFRKNGKDVFVLQTSEGLEFYEFDEQYKLNEIIRTKNMGRKTDSDRLFFGHFTTNDFKDIIHLNDNGLSLYQYSDKIKDFSLVDHNIEFSQSYGWRSLFSDSIQLVDLDNDGIDELLFTGSNGLNVCTFNASKMKWENVLNSSQLGGLLRYSTVVGSVNIDANKPIVFTQDISSSFQWMYIVASTNTVTIPNDNDSRTKKPFRPFQSSLIRPPAISRISLHAIPTSRWTEQWDNGFLKEAVRLETGQVEFSIPLIKAGPIPALEFAIGISYNSQDTSSDLLGTGWTIPIANYYIAVDHKGSVFPADREYYLIREGRKANLIVKTVTANAIEFKIQEQPELKITYDLPDQRWFVGDDVEQAIFGVSTDRKFGVFQSTLKWPSWRGSGTDTSQLEQDIQRWYLCEHRSIKNEHSIYYKYETLTSSIDGKDYTVSARLISIEDGREFQVNFDYAPKTSTEYKSLSPINANKIVTFPLQLIHTHYLQSCTIRTLAYRRRIDFGYELVDGSRLLVEMNQPIENHIEPIFSFRYNNEMNKLLMSTCIYMDKSSISFDYTETTSSVPPFSLQYHVDERPQITYGPDYAIMAYKSKVEVNFRLTNVALTIPIFKGTTFTERSNSNVQSFMIRAFHNSFIVVQISDNIISVLMYKKTDDKWSDVPKIEIFSKESLISFGDSFCAIVEPYSKNLIILDRDDNQSEWKRLSLDLPDQKIMKRMEVQNRLIVGHNGQQLYVFYKDEHNKWLSDVIDRDIGQLYQRTQTTIGLFDIEPTLKQQLISVFENDGLQMFNNMIVATSLQEESGVLMLVIKCYLLDTNHKVTKTFIEQVSREKLVDLMLERENDGTNFIMKYHLSDGKYIIKIIDFTGKMADEVNSISNKNKREDARNDLLTRINSLDGWKTFFKNSILFDNAVYRTQLSKDGLFVGNDIFLQMTGIEWKKESRPSMEYVRLGESFILGFSQKDSKSVYLYRQTTDGKTSETIRHIRLNRPGEFINRYPAYLAYHSSATDVTVLTFKDPRTIGKEERYTSEELLFESNLTNLMSVAKLTSKAGLKYEWRVRSLSNFMESKPYLTVERCSLINDNIERATAYERSSKYKREEGVVEETLKIIPDGDRTSSGWIEHKQVNNIETTETSMKTNYYDSAGKLVSTETSESKDDKRESKENDGKTLSGHQIFDKSGKLEIANFIPYKVSDDEVVYFGFELYEDNQGTTFDPAQIVRGKFSFTGDSYLNLKKNSKFIKILKPKNTENIFISSCYVRSNSPMVHKSEVRYLRVMLTASNFQNKEILSKVLRQSGEWFYLESYIDLIALKREHGALDNLQVTIEVTSDSADVLDVDHIRFSPLTQNFEATVYNPQNGKAMAKISDNGFVSRTIFDRQFREIAGIKVDEQIDYFTRTTKTGKLIPAPRTSINEQPSSKIKFEPESGFYEHFDETAFSNRWSVSDQRMWQISRGQLVHRGIEMDTIIANTNLIDRSCAAVRFGYNLRLLKSSLNLRWSDVSISLYTLKENQATLKLNANSSSVIDNLPVIGELLIFIEVERIVVWIDGVLVIDQGHGFDNLLEPWSEFKFEMTNYLVIEDLFIMNRPRIHLEYFNGWGEKIQVLQFESNKVIQVSQTLYDEFGRGVITTKPTRVSRDLSQSLFAFYQDFVENENPKDSNSVWKTGVLKGDVDTLNKNDLGVSYTRTKYDNNPMNEKISEGLPGPEYAISGPYAKHFSKDSNVEFMNNLFPESSGYRQQVTILSNGSQQISVFDSNKNIVARYVRVSGFNHLLSTSEYDKDNRLIKILPPLYHEMAKTADKVTPWISGEKLLTDTEKRLQQTYGSHFTYDKDGNLIEKKTPDGGMVKYMYTTDGDLRFMVTMGEENSVKRVVYFVYDEFQQLVRTGYLSIPMSIDQLKYSLNTDYLPNAVDYQKFQYSDQTDDSTERGNKKSLVTYSDLEPVQEIVKFNSDQDLLSREFYALPQKIQFDISSRIISIRKEYNRDAVSAITYPGLFEGKPFKLFYAYNYLGNIVGLGTEHNYSYFASFEYHINGLVSLETHTPTSTFAFSRIYKYNSPGFLERISDLYLTEDISYTHGGYGVNGFGDGTVLLTTFNAKWLHNADKRLFRVNNINENFIPAECINALETLGYIDALGNPIKLYIQNAELSMPLKCRGGIGLRMARLVAEKQIPRFYGFRFAYGNYKELINGKYFTDETYRLIEPLQLHSFSKSTNLTTEQSQAIFDILSANNYILIDQRPDLQSAIGKRGHKHFFRDDDLEKDLEALNEVFGVFSLAIISLLTSIISQRKSISLYMFQQIFLKWRNFDKDTTKQILDKTNEDSRAIFEMLSSKGYTTEMAFKQEFRSILSNYKNLIPDIVRTLNNHFIHALGETPFDFESYNIDPNGNHRNFYTGFERYEFIYKNGTNQISDVKINNFQGIESDKTYKMVHDTDGNVVKALHKNIEEIEYNSTSQKTTSIRMTDGRKLLFYYDAQGERILKRVMSSSGVISKDTYYIRDEQGRVLLDRQITNFPGPNSKQIIVTMYIYGPRSLIGFIRNDKFHSVVTDHSGSVRLIIRDGQVITAFDYLPYGQIMRVYGNNPQDTIVYRYTGQEYDEETGLYNYHARLYDPEIGRFYQTDPQAQYYSPYKYAGNSPVSLVDPDGEFAITLSIAIAVAIGGAYLGGAASNNRWNPVDWDFKDSGTWIGIVGGGITGALLPTGVGASVGAISIGGTVGLGAGGMYLSAAAANGNWNPDDWQWDSPQTWSAIFQGFAAGAGIAGSVKGLHKFTETFSTGFGQKTFLNVSYGSAGGVAFGSTVMVNNGNAAFWEWDFSNPATWQALLDGFDSGAGMPTSFVDVGRNLKKITKTPNKLSSLLNKVENMPRRLKDYGEILKNPKHPLYKVALVTASTFYFVGDANGDFDVTNWRNTFSTYHGLLKGVFFGKDLNEKITNAANKRKIPKPGMVELVSYKTIESDRKRRFAQSHSLVDQYNNLSTVVIMSIEQINSTDLNDFIEIPISDSDMVTSAGVPISFWPLSIFRIIKSTFSVGNRYCAYKNKQSSNSKSVPISPDPLTTPKDSPNKLCATPGIQFNQFENDHSSSVLEMGDKWLANTNMAGNFMWAFVLFQKLFGDKSYKSSSKPNDNDNQIEFDIQAYEIVHKFIENTTSAAVYCGIEKGILEIINSGKLDHLVSGVKIKLMNGRNDEIPEMLFESLIGTNSNKINKASSLKQVNKFKKRVKKIIRNLKNRIDNISCGSYPAVMSFNRNNLPTHSDCLIKNCNLPHISSNLSLR